MDTDYGDNEVRKIVQARDVIFNDEKKETEEPKETIYMDEESREERIDEEKTQENKNEENDKNEKRTRRKPTYLQDYRCDDFHECEFTAFGVENLDEDIPKTKQEALQSDDKDKWLKAVEDELKSHEKNNTWTVIKKPEGKKVINSRWVFRIKIENNSKARLVAKGYETTEWNEIYAPVGKLATLKTLLSIANQENMNIEQMDVKTAFLHGKLQEEIYMHLPEDMNNEEYVCKLNKALYGLKQSPRCWNEVFHKFMLEMEFQCLAYDTCLYTQNDGMKFYVFLYVDDILIFHNDINVINEFQKNLMLNFDMICLGPVQKFLGIEIERDRERNILKVHQKSYIEKLLIKFNMQNCKIIATPVEKGLKLAPETNTKLLTKQPIESL